MNNFVEKLSIYEQLAYFFVGGVAYIVILCDLYLLKITIPPIFLEIIFIVVSSYFLGHLSQAISNIFLRANEYKKAFDDSQLEILKNVKDDCFKGKNITDLYVFEYCYLHTLSSSHSSHISSFLANYGLYRGWTVIFILESIFLLFQLIILLSKSGFIVTHLFVLFLISCVVSFLLYMRAIRFKKYFTKKVFQIYSINKLKTE